MRDVETVRAALDLAVPEQMCPDCSHDECLCAQTQGAATMALERLAGRVAEAEQNFRDLAAAYSSLAEERDEERERFHRHVEEMLEPKLLARVAEAEKALGEARDVLLTIAEFVESRHKEGDTEYQVAIVARAGLRLSKDAALQAGVLTPPEAVQAGTDANDD